MKHCTTCSKNTHNTSLGNKLASTLINETRQKSPTRSSSSDLVWLMQAVSSLSTLSAVWCTVWKRGIKHREGFISVSIRLRWGENMSDFVYSHFHVDPLLLKPLLHTYCIFEEYLTKILHKEEPFLLQHQQLNLVVSWSSLSCLCRDLVFPVYSVKSILPVICMLLCEFFSPGIFQCLIWQRLWKLPLLFLMSSRPEMHCAHSVHFLAFSHAAVRAFMSLTSLTVHCERALMIDSHVDSMWSCLFWYVINALSGLTSVTFCFWMFNDQWEHVSDLTAILLCWVLLQGLRDPCRADREHKSGKPSSSVSGKLDFQTHKCTLGFFLPYFQQHVTEGLR